MLVARFADAEPAALRADVRRATEYLMLDTKKMRGGKPYVFSNMRVGTGVPAIADFIGRAGGLN